MPAHRYWRIRVVANAGGAVPGPSASGTVVITECTWASTTGGAQIATGGTASSPNGGTPSNAFDGSTSTSWQSLGFNAAAQGQGASLVYDWGPGNAVEPVQIRIYFSGLTSLAPRDFYIECSDDGTYWFYRHYVSGQTGWTNGSTRSFTIPDASVNEAIEPHIYWRMFTSGVSGGNTSGIHCMEAEFALTVGGADIANGGSASASSAVSAASNAFDNNNFTNFQSNALSTGWQWLQYTFASAVDPIEFRFRTQAATTAGAPTTIFIQYSDDNSRWTDAYYATGLSWSNGENKSFTPIGSGGSVVEDPWAGRQRFHPSDILVRAAPRLNQRIYPLG